MSRGLVHDAPTGCRYERAFLPRLPRTRLVRYRHVCPDGTRVWVSAQWLPSTNTTLYRWHVPGEVAQARTSVPGHAGAPDYTMVDAQHPLWLKEAHEVEPECPACGDAGCPWCSDEERVVRPGGDDPGWQDEVDGWGDLPF